jgi:vacuolar-type H+-ATPase subunit I/STV1
MFGTNWAELKVKITELELRIDSLQSKFRSLEQEWLNQLSRNDAILKRANRLLKLELKPENDQHPAQAVQQVIPAYELTEDQIIAEFYAKGGR